MCSLLSLVLIPVIAPQFVFGEPQVQWRHRKQMLLLELVLPVNPKRRDMWTRLDLTSVAIVTQERPCAPSWPREIPLSLGPFAVLLLGTAASESPLPRVLVCAGRGLWTFGHLGECVVVSCCVFYFYLLNLNSFSVLLWKIVNVPESCQEFHSVHSCTFIWSPPLAFYYVCFITCLSFCPSVSRILGGRHFRVSWEHQYTSP